MRREPSVYALVSAFGASVYNEVERVPYLLAFLGGQPRRRQLIEAMPKSCHYGASSKCTSVAVTAPNTGTSFSAMATSAAGSVTSMSTK